MFDEIEPDAGKGADVEAVVAVEGKKSGPFCPQPVSRPPNIKSAMMEWPLKLAFLIKPHLPRISKKAFI